MKWADLTYDELAEGLRENPDLARRLGIGDEDDARRRSRPARTEVRESVHEGVSRSDLDGALLEAREELEDDVERRVEEALREQRTELDREGRELREAARLRDLAHAAIREAELPTGWEGDLLRQYEVGVDGPTPRLLLEAEGMSREDAVLEQVERDVQRAEERLAEAAGGPVVRGMGGQAERDGVRGGEHPGPDWREGLFESDATDEDVKSMVMEGI